ncbi:MAG: hypothetical protein ACE5J4_02720 [Candidatus Aenigmatarchaeota archaeon]
MKKRFDVIKKGIPQLGLYGSKPDEARSINDKNLVDVTKELSEDDFEYGITISYLMRKKAATA